MADGSVDDLKIVLRKNLGVRGVVSLTTDEIKEALRDDRGKDKDAD